MPAIRRLKTVHSSTLIAACVLACAAAAPTQPAATELSLDYVFRHVTPAKGTPGQPNFSFDQFFSQESQQDAATSGGEPPREPTTGESDDIQQFNAWLEGLKKS